MMTLTFRHRIVLTLVPLLVLIAVVGGSGVLLLARVGKSIDRILRGNYTNVIAMERLDDALEQIDASFEFALAGRVEQARKQYDDSWKRYEMYLTKKQHNVIFDEDRDLTAQLTGLSDSYRRQGDDFFGPGGLRKEQLFGEPGQPGLVDTLKDIKQVCAEIRRVSEHDMEQANERARELAATSRIWFAVGLGTAVVLALLLALQTIRTIVRPIQAVTESALAVGSGDLDKTVPMLCDDELGQLAQAFNTMTRRLRAYRESEYGKLLRAERTSQATIDSFPEPVLVIDHNNCVELANPAARRLLAVNPAGFAQNSRLAWEPPTGLRQPIEEAIRHQRAYIPQGFDEAIVLSTDDRDCYFLPRVMPIRDAEGLTRGAAVVLEDVTRFRLLDQVKSNLVATVSHELKTPLTSIRLAVYLLLEQMVGPLSPKQKELLADARDNTERLLVMINNLLDLARLERGHGQLDLQPVQPAKLLEAAAESMRCRIAEKGLELIVDASSDLPTVMADAQRLGHALRNLLENAVTYTEPGGRVTLGASAGANAVTLTVADSGIGIPAEHLQHVFEKFFRIPGQSRGEGTGLGLAIVHEIATAHGGTVACESRLGEGTVFRLMVPAWHELLTPLVQARSVPAPA